ncbi:MAG: FAD-binding domain-containing protein [Burkholderiaceae bacterium]
MNAAFQPGHPDFPPGRAAALARLAGVAADDYARTRNYLDGQVTGLSPYLTHGLLGLDEAVAHARMVLALEGRHKLINEFGWRAYWQHVFRHLHADGIRVPRQPPPAPASTYAERVPADVREARTGLTVIDASVRMLYDTGYVHNHARMWLASYLVHQRRVDWRAGADWMIGHLLDGDLASNTLSWQWVAGTWTGKPYLFNDENVARFAPPLAQPGSVLDRSYEEMARRAAHGALGGLPAPVGRCAGVDEPGVADAPPAALLAEYPLLDIASLAAFDDQPLLCRHPFAIGWRADESAAAVGVLVTEWHRQHRWSPRRWRFVLQSLARGGQPIVMASRAQWTHWLAGRRAPVFWPTDEHLADSWPRASVRLPMLIEVARRTPFAEPAGLQASFSAWWRAVQRAGPFDG